MFGGIGWEAAKFYSKIKEPLPWLSVCPADHPRRQHGPRRACIFLHHPFQRCSNALDGARRL
jgi:hypothetical protein